MSNLQEIADLENTVQVSARRFEESPYIARTGSPEMVRGVYAGRYLAIHNKEDPIEKYWQLRRKALIFDVVLAHYIPLLRSLLVVRECEVEVFRHTTTAIIDIPADHLCVHVPLGRRFKQKGTGLVHPALLGR